jgi:hypothetical protein
MSASLSEPLASDAGPATIEWRALMIYVTRNQARQMGAEMIIEKLETRQKEIRKELKALFAERQALAEQLTFKARFSRRLAGALAYFRS